MKNKIVFACMHACKNKNKSILFLFDCTKLKLVSIYYLKGYRRNTMSTWFYAFSNFSFINKFI